MRIVAGAIGQLAHAGGEFVEGDGCGFGHGAAPAVGKPIVPQSKAGLQAAA